jgi:diguanylate cyclase (GGDEF)-like protein/PAS domain S-box-containing protein
MLLAKVAMTRHDATSRAPGEVFEALHEIAVAVGGVLDPIGLARIVVDRAATLLAADAAALYMWDQEACALRPLYSNDSRPLPVHLDEVLEPGQGIAGLAFARREPIAVNDYATWHQALPRAAALGLRAALAAPLVVADRAVGALVVRSYTPHAYRAEQQHLLALLGAQVAPALEAARLLTASEQLAREAAERAAELAASERRLRALVGSTRDVVAVLDEQCLVSYVSPTVKWLWGCVAQDVAGHGAFDRVHPEDLERVRDAFGEALSASTTASTTEVRVQHADGSWRDFELILNNQLLDPAVAGIVATYHDITERKSFEHDLRYLAFHDPLLDVPNRTLFMERLEQALAENRPRGSSVAVLFVDLDDFKLINDSLGHRAGDQLLMSVTDRLQASVREKDDIARLGGDEFAVLLDRVEGADDAIRVAQRILGRLQDPIQLDGHEVVQAVSIGIAIAGPGCAAADALVRNADMAMYHAKTNGKGCYELFDRSMDVHAAERLALVGDLRRAIERGEMRVYYQPLVTLASGEICATEALVRWQHPVRGLVPPDQFIPLAEDTGLIIPLGEWVLEEACRQADTWHKLRPMDPPLVLNVNLSAKQLHQSDLVQRVAHILDETHFDPRALTLEVTESVATQNPERTIANLHGLKALGVKLAVDDFGTGYSSLTYLKRFPLDSIKIDRSFVDGLGTDLDDTAIVRAVVALAKALNLRVTAEGVETKEQLAYLRMLACDNAQGYYFARPAPAGVLTEMLLASARGASAQVRAA